MPRKKTVTLHDLSAKLGLSSHTVSRALRGLPGMSEETRAHVLRTAKQLGYRTREKAHSLAAERIPLYTEKPRLFKMIVPSRAGTANTLIHQLLTGIQETLSEFRHTLELVVALDYSEQTERFEQWADKHHLIYADGLFVSPLLESAFERRLLALPVPKILLNFPPKPASADSVIWDVGTAIRQSVDHLLACGHRRILFVGATRPHRGFRLRWRSFMEAMEDAGITVALEEHVTGTLSKEDWISQVTDKLHSMRATAILSAINHDLAWIYHACSLLGKRIPNDYSLISLENSLNEWLPSLSRPLLPVRETGVRAGERMLWRLANPRAPYEHTMLQGQFFSGDTVRKLEESCV